MMKLTSALLFATASSLLAQTTRPAVHHAASASNSTAAQACAKLPQLSSKIPALPADASCPKPLYTLEPPTVKLAYASPLEGPDLREQLGIESSSISLDFVDIKTGTGELVAPHKFLSIHYTGYLVDGTKFDSSVDRGEPLDIAYGAHKVILGWDTGFGGMRVGGKRRLFVPYQLAYGPSQYQTIPPKSMLIFDVEVVKVSDTAPVHKDTHAAPPVSQPSTSQPPAASAVPQSSRPTTIPGAGTSPAPDGTKPAQPTPSTDPTKPTAAPPPLSKP